MALESLQTILVNRTTQVIGDDHLVLPDEIAELLHLSGAGRRRDVGVHRYGRLVGHDFLTSLVAVLVLGRHLTVIQQIPEEDLFLFSVFIPSTSHHGGKGNNIPQQRRQHITVFIGLGDTVLAVSGLPFGTPLIQQLHGDLHLSVNELVRNNGHGGVKGVCLAAHLISGDRKVGGKRVLVCLAGHGFHHLELFGVSHAFHLSFLQIYKLLVELLVAGISRQ